MKIGFYVYQGLLPGEKAGHCGGVIHRLIGSLHRCEPRRSRGPTLSHALCQPPQTVRDYQPSTIRRQDTNCSNGPWLGSDRQRRLQDCPGPHSRRSVAGNGLSKANNLSVAMLDALSCTALTLSPLPNPSRRQPQKRKHAWEPVVAQ